MAEDNVVCLKSKRELKLKKIDNEDEKLFIISDIEMDNKLLGVISIILFKLELIYINYNIDIYTINPFILLTDILFKVPDIDTILSDIVNSVNENNLEQLDLFCNDIVKLFIVEHQTKI